MIMYQPKQFVTIWREDDHDDYGHTAGTESGRKTLFLKRKWMIQSNKSLLLNDN